MEIASLGLEVKYSEVDKAQASLQKLAGAATQAEAAAKGLGTGHAGAAPRIAAVTTATQRQTQALNDNAKAAKWAAMQQRNLLFQLNDVGVSLVSGMPIWMVAAQQGSQIAQIWGPKEGGVGRAFKETGNLIVGALTKFPLVTAAVAAAAVGFAGLTYEINQTTDQSVSLMNTMQAAVTVIAEGIYSLLQPAIEAIAPWFEAAWNRVVEGSKYVGNQLARFIVGSIEIIKFAINNLPDIFAAAGEAAANAFLSAMEQMIRETLVGVNDLITDINGMLPTNYQMPLAPAPMSVKLGRVDIGGESAFGRLSKEYDALDKRAAEIASTDYMGNYFQSVRDKAIELAKASEDAGKKTKEAAEKAVDPWKGLRKVSESARKEMREMERQAKLTRDAWVDFGEAGLDIFTGLATGTMDWKDALRAAIPAVEDLIRSLLKANSLGGGTGSGGGGGILGGLFGWIGSLFGGGGAGGDPWSGLRFAKGGAFNDGRVVPFARGGVVNKPTLFPMAKGAGLMGEAGPEGILPLRRNSSGQLGVMAAGIGGAMNDNRTYNIDARGAQQGVGQEIRRALEEYDRKVAPVTWNRINADRRAVG